MDAEFTSEDIDYYEDMVERLEKELAEKSGQCEELRLQSIESHRRQGIAERATLEARKAFAEEIIERALREYDEEDVCTLHILLTYVRALASTYPSQQEAP